MKKLFTVLTGTAFALLLLTLAPFQTVESFEKNEKIIRSEY